MRFTIIRLLCISFILWVGARPSIGAEPAQISVAAAISLRDALDEIAKAYESSHGVHVALTYGGSGQLLAQIKAGAPVDIFISAAPQQVDELEKAKLAVPGSRRLIVRNQLVLIVPRDAKDVPTSLAGLTDAARFKRIAVGEPKTVPAGQYAMQSIRAAGIEEQLKPRLVMGLNVRQVLEYVRRGEADAGLVYRTDAIAAGDAVRVCCVVEGHDPIEYPAAVVSRAGAGAGGADAASATRFLDYLTGDDARSVFIRRGFELPTEEGAATRSATARQRDDNVAPTTTPRAPATTAPYTAPSREPSGAP